MDHLGRGDPRHWARNQEIVIGLGIQPWWKKPTDMKMPSGDFDRPKGPWHVLLMRHPQTNAEFRKPYL